MLDDFVFASVKNQRGNIDVIYIHGLSGNAVDTWTCAESTDPSGNFWPTWLGEDVPSANIHTLGHPVSVFGKISSKEMNIYERSRTVLEYISTFDIGDKPIAVIAHSLGGILAKQIIQTGATSGNKDWKAIALQIKLVMFLATPHTGAVLASVLKFALPRLGSQHIDLLEPGNAHLDLLNSNYRQHANANGLKTVAYYEKHNTKKLALVVSKESADPGVVDCEPIAIDANHETICKPKDRNDIVYRSAVKHISRFSRDSAPLPPTSSGGGGAHFSADDYTDPTSYDRRDLHQKLIDSGQEHEYRYALDAQSKFARDYYRNGLNVVSRALHDSLLTDVEQRFKLHVHSGAICLDKPSDVTRRLLQSEVIDPLLLKYKDVENFSAQTVMRAMYYLAEKCYISWDRI